ncbi:MAG TPA: TM0106 family RecB-like putative nuclease [Acidimicrobiales bacterium]|nr:TM0106 family RecB-like putative nuclease [Acidimicrobiales bacterium]
MYFEDEQLVLSPTDLVGFLYCDHLTELSLRVARHLLEKPTGDDAEMAVVQNRGIEHELQYLARLRAEGREVTEIPGSDDLVRQVQLTNEALADGPDVIYQAGFVDRTGDGPIWRGHADFLSKVPVPSYFGTYSYEPEDTKLARHVRPSAVLQLCEYAEQLARLQGHPPEHIHVVLGGQEKVSLRLADFAAYFRAAKARFVDACINGVKAYPDPVAHCAVCAWRDRCDDQRIQDDRLTLVFGLRTDQARKLAERADISTVAELAAFTDDQVPGITRSTFHKLRRQAALQVEARAHPDTPPPHELLEVNEPGLGLAALPEPSPGDLFFDIEGDPFVGGGGLEYLLGVGWLEADQSFAFRSFWAHTPEEEKASFESFIDFVMDRLTAYPDLHIYHYAAYEPLALGKLMGRYGTRELEVDFLLRGQVLIDLFRVVRQGVRVGTPSYSLKKLEALYMRPRTEAITDAGSSIIEYERWLADPDQQILDDIEVYNRVDCESTRLLRDWLEVRRTEFASTFGKALSRPNPAIADAPPDVAEQMELNDALRIGLTDSAATSGAAVERASELLGHLLDWHRREDKPEWWMYYHRALDCDEDDLYLDTESIAGLEYEGEVGNQKRSIIHRYSFDPAQEFKIKAEDSVVNPESVRANRPGETKIPGPGTLVSLDADVGVLELTRGTNSLAPHPRCLIPGGPLDTKNQRDALQRIAVSMIRDGIDGDGPYRAARDLLLRRRPRTHPTLAGGKLVDANEAAGDAVVRVGLQLDHGCLAVQGPPGSGKTRAAASLAVALIDAGKSVGIAAHGHAVITNLLDEIGEQADMAGVDFRASQKSNGKNFSSHSSVTQRTNNGEMADDLADGADLLAGTAWMFARDQFDQSLDYLILDEAGQFSLANTMAVATAAKNLVLVGDPLQLAQPSKGAHPTGANASALGHMLGDAGTLPDELGVFLDRTHRLHPEICAFISEIVYEGRLQSEPGCERQAVSGDDELGGSGLRWRPVDHVGNRVDSSEEVDEVNACYRALLGRTFTDKDGAERPLTAADVKIVAPYNAQVRLLKQKLPPGALVGTVDKYQGQQAPVVIVSLTTSSLEDIPRGMEFLYSRNRLNVAVSRAQAMTIVVGSPKLLTVKCRSIDQLRLVNGLCRYVEMAT